MACKVRLNVVCSSREKRFLVIAYEDWLLEDVKKCVEIVFQKLYPNEQSLKVSKLQNEFHFDLPQHYTVGDTLADAGLVFAIEEEKNLIIDRDSSYVPSHLPEEIHTKKRKPKRKKKSKNQKKPCKRTRTDNNMTTVMEKHCSSSDNKVTSTTGSPVNLIFEDCKLMPQVIEKVLCEDGEVDIETVEDEYS